MILSEHLNRPIDMTVTAAVLRAMERIAPLRLAEKWDNVSDIRSES